MSKKIIMVAGPNGAGKTTFARAFLPAEAQCPRFINADLIAAGLSPFMPEAEAFKAGRLMLKEIAECVGRGDSFAFETTLSGLVYLRQIRKWQNQGYHVSLFFLSLPTVEMAIARVAERVRQGGGSCKTQRLSGINCRVMRQKKVEVGGHCWQDKGSEDLINARYEYYAKKRNHATVEYHSVRTDARIAERGWRADAEVAPGCAYPGMGAYRGVCEFELEWMRAS